jgi:hypothetical protein
MTMSYEEKFDAVVAEIAGFRWNEYPEDIIDEVRDELLADQREFLEERLEKELKNYDWWEDGKDIARMYLIQRMLTERLTPEERAEGAAIKKAEAVKSAQSDLDCALKALKDTQDSIEEATRRGKPKMLRHYTLLEKQCEAKVERCKAQLTNIRPA